MVSIQCPYCKHRWDFKGKTRGLTNKVRCSNTECRKWFGLSNKKISELKKAKEPETIVVELERHGITNCGLHNIVIGSVVEILLRISNPTQKKIGISKILVESHDKDYIITTGMQLIKNNKYINVNAISLSSEETKVIRLFQEGNVVISKDKIFVPAVIKIYDTRHKTMKEMPIKLYIGYRHL